MGGGCDDRTEYVELLADGVGVAKATGRCSESMDSIGCALRIGFTKCLQNREFVEMPSFSANCSAKPWFFPAVTVMSQGVLLTWCITFEKKRTTARASKTTQCSSVSLFLSTGKLSRLVPKFEARFLATPGLTRAASLLDP